MSGRRPRAACAAASFVVAAVMLAGCGSKAAPAALPAAPPAPPPLATSFASATGTGLAIVEMGGSAAQENNFWQLFARPAGATTWRLATPLGVADNGGLVVVSSGSGSLVTGFRPSQELTYSPLADSADGGTNWSPDGLLAPGLANVPDALAAGPDGRMIALTDSGAVETGTTTSWTRISSAKALAATAVGKACGTTSLTGVTFNGETPVVAASCDRPGVAGIFADSGGSWRRAGPSVPAEDIDVLRLAATGTGLVALLRAGTGASASIIGAWYDGGRWTLSAPLRAASLRSTALGPDGSIGVTLNASRGATLAGPGAAWHALPALPKSTATLALGPSGRVDALAVNGGTFRDWLLGGAGWSLVQTVHVDIPYGSSS